MGDVIACTGDENRGKSKVAVPSSKWMSPESPSASSSSLLRFGGESSIGSKSILRTHRRTKNKVVVRNGESD